MTKVAVIGAGITGATTAYALMERGCDVTIIERERYAGHVTSYANGGQLSASNAEVWNSWGTVRKGLTMMLKKDAPLSVNPSPSLHKYGWFTRFLTEIPNHDENTIETTRLAIDARTHLLRMAEEENIEFDCVKRGLLHFYKNKKDFEAAKKGNELMARGGLTRSAVTPEEIRDLVPSLHCEAYAGFYTPDDFTGDINKYTRGLVDAMIRKGVTVLFETQVSGFVAENNTVTLKLSDKDGNGDDHKTFDRVVVCAGVASHQMAAMIGDNINVYPVKGYSITVTIPETAQDSAPWVSLLDEQAKIVTSRLGADRFRVAGTAEFNGYNLDIRKDRVDPLVKWVQTHFPDLPTNQTVSWAGLRPMTPNMMPRVGRGAMPGTFYNTGHGHLGWTLSAITAQMASEMTLGANN